MKYKYFKTSNAYFEFYNKAKEKIKINRIYYKGNIICIKYRMKEGLV